MGYYVHYKLKLIIKKKNIEKALEIFNFLHTDDMLEKYARGGSSKQTGNVRDYKWYSWVNNPETPYTDLTEAFKNWCIVEDDVKMECTPTGDFEISGEYSNKWGQQDFLIARLAPVLEDTMIKVKGQCGAVFFWGVCNYSYINDYIDSEESDESSDSEE
jgi:hypothetical protein